MWKLDCEESWAPKNWCFWTVVLEKTLESPLDCKEIQPVNPKGAQSWVFIGRTDAKAETPILWPRHAKSWLIGKASDAGRDWGQEEKGTTEDEMAGWHQRLDGHEFEWTPGVGDGQGGLACCNSWGRKELDTTELNWTEWNNCTSHLTVGCYIPSFNPVRPSAWRPSPVHTYSKAKSIRCLGIPLSVQQDKKYNNYVLTGVYFYHICWHTPSIKLQTSLCHRITYFLFLGLTSN